MDNRRYILAFLLSPLVMPLLIIVWFPFIGASYADIVGSLVFYTPYAYITTAILLMPLLFIFRALGLKNIFAYIVGGIVFGLIALVPLALWLFPQADWFHFMFWSAFGGLSALVSWLILYKLKIYEQPQV